VHRAELNPSTPVPTGRPARKPCRRSGLPRAGSQLGGTRPPPPDRVLPAPARVSPDETHAGAPLRAPSQRFDATIYESRPFPVSPAKGATLYQLGLARSRSVLARPFVTLPRANFSSLMNAVVG
jgi:hypothetical protein